MSWLRRLFNTLRPRRVERDIDREMTFASVAGMVMAVAALAARVPAARATFMQPMRTLREE